MPSVPRIRIVLNLLMSLVTKRGQISLSEAVKMFDIDESSLTSVVHILVEKKVLTLEYTAEGERIIGKGAAIEGTDYIKIKQTVDNIIDSIKEQDLEAAKKSEETQAKKIRKTPGTDE